MMFKAARAIANSSCKTRKATTFALKSEFLFLCLNGDLLPQNRFGGGVLVWLMFRLPEQFRFSQQHHRKM